MTTAAISREWFTTYCQNAAANVLDKDNKVRFSYNELKTSLDAATRHCSEDVNISVLALHNNIMKLCNMRNGEQDLSDNDEWALLLTLLNIHAAYLMISGLWKEEPAQPETDEYGFEIF